jgi:hypothetical protein
LGCINVRTSGAPLGAANIWHGAMPAGWDPEAQVPVVVADVVGGPVVAAVETPVDWPVVPAGAAPVVAPTTGPVVPAFWPVVPAGPVVDAPVVGDRASVVRPVVVTPDTCSSTSTVSMLIVTRLVLVLGSQTA